MGFLSDLFVGSKGGPQQIDPQISKFGTITQPQQEVLNKILGGFAAPGGIEAPTFAPSGGGPLIPGLTQGQEFSLAALEERAMQLASGEGLAADAESTTQRLLTQGPQDTSQFFQQAIQAPLEEQFLGQGGTLDQLDRQLSAKAFSGERLRARNEATEDFFRILSQRQQETALSERARTDQVALQALGLTPTVQGLPGQLTQALDFARQPQLQQTLFEFDIFRQQQEETARRRQAALAAAFGQTFENIGSQTFIEPSQKGLVQIALEEAIKGTVNPGGGGGEDQLGTILAALGGGGSTGTAASSGFN